MPMSGGALWGAARPSRAGHHRRCGPSKRECCCYFFAPFQWCQLSLRLFWLEMQMSSLVPFSCSNGHRATERSSLISKWNVLVAGELGPASLPRRPLATHTTFLHMSSQSRLPTYINYGTSYDPPVSTLLAGSSCGTILLSSSPTPVATLLSCSSLWTSAERVIFGGTVKLGGCAVGGDTQMVGGLMLVSKWGPLCRRTYLQ